MKKALLLLAILSSVNSEAQVWQKTTAPDTIRYSGIRTWGKDTIYAWGISPSSTYQNDILATSFDGGQTWVTGRWKYRFTNQIVASPAGLHVGYFNLASSEANLQYTSDGGVTWNIVNGSVLGSNRYYSPLGILSNGKLLLARFGEGKLNISPDYISLGTDYGNVFQYTDDFTYYATNPNTGRTIFGRNSGETHLKYTDDNGLTFTDKSLASVVGNVYSPIVRYAKDNTFFNAWMGGVNISTDDGITWTHCSPVPSGLKDMEANKFGQVMVISNNKEIFSSADNGQTWTSVLSGLPSNPDGSAIGKTTDGTFWLTMYGNIPAEGGIYKLLPSTGIENTNQEKITASVYPNPAKNIITIKENGNATKAVSYKVFSADGKYFDLKTANNTIDISSLAPGNYFVQILYTHTIQNVQFVKQ